MSLRNDRAVRLMRALRLVRADSETLSEGQRKALTLILDAEARRPLRGIIARPPRGLFAQSDNQET